MRDRDLINQLKTLKNIHPDKNWVALTRSRITQMDADGKTDERRYGFSLTHLFGLTIPRQVTVSVLGLIVLVTATASVAQLGPGNDFASISRYEPVSSETIQELKEIAESVIGNDFEARDSSIENVDYTVVFNEDSDKRESFKDALRNRIESKISFYNDLLSQLDDGDLAREISLNPSRGELYSKLTNEETAEQVKELLEGAREALDEGSLIDALDLVTAIDRLLK